MYTLFVFFCLIVFQSTAFSEPIAQEAISTQTLGLGQQRQKPTVMRVQAKGIVCSFCAQGVKHAFGAHPAVEKVVFGASFNQLDIYVKRGMSLSEDEIRKRITDSGYLVETVSALRE